MGKQLTVVGGALAKATASKLLKNRNKTLAQAAKIDRVVLLDSSGSMGAMDATGMNGIPCSRFDALRQAWMRLAPMAKGRLAAFVFSDNTQPVKGSASGNPGALPHLNGGTAMCKAFGAALQLRHPRMRALLISDGESTDGDPVPSAQLLRCPVDTVFVGPKDGPGKLTLMRIASATGGAFRDMGSKFDASKFLEHCKLVLRLEEGK